MLPASQTAKLDYQMGEAVAMATLQSTPDTSEEELARSAKIALKIYIKNPTIEQIVVVMQQTRAKLNPNPLRAKLKQKPYLRLDQTNLTQRWIAERNKRRSSFSAMANKQGK